RARALRHLPGTAARIDAALAQLQAVLDQVPAADGAGWEPLRHEAWLAAAEHLAFTGRVQDLAGAVQAMPPAHSPAMQLRMDCLQAEASFLNGRVEEAVRRARRLRQAAAGPGVSARERERVLGKVYEIYFISGLWRRCAAMLKADDQPAVFGAGGTVAGELAAGILHAAGGRADRALEELSGVIAHLRPAGRPGTLSLALCAAAYPAALQGDLAQAKGHLRDEAGLEPDGPWAGRMMAQYFRFLALAGLGNLQEAAAGLASCAGKAAELGQHAHLCLYLGAAARLGDAQALRHLAHAAAGASWPQARMHHAFAAGRLAADGKLLLQAAELARLEGNALFAFELARDLVQSAAGLAQVRQARRLRNASFRNLRRDRAVRHRISELSDFERGLAMAAGQGRSSSSLARGLHLSPRTAGWHLGRIYSRLHVSSRAELREVLA
ncbi:hypothetical protein HER39_04350, partial [Arthrobacter deserti]|nr:hypothetical protein [Arthrobacter deserti]